MANTKTIANKTERKAKKRALRKNLKGEYYALTKEQKRRFRNGEIKGLRKFKAEAATAAT